MANKKKKVKHHRLSAEEHPLFIGMTPKVHRTKKDKALMRQNQKLVLRKELLSYD